MKSSAIRWRNSSALNDGGRPTQFNISGKEIVSRFSIEPANSSRIERLCVAAMLHRAKRKTREGQEIWAKTKQKQRDAFSVPPITKQFIS